MNIILMGFGKMGKKISQLARNKGYIVGGFSSSSNPISNLDLRNVDVAIDFSTPETAFNNVKYALDNNIPVISGTTGWNNKLEKIKKICIEKNGAMLHSANFSIGMNIIFEANKKISCLIKNFNYKIKISETHHLQKKDMPSGSAIQLANDIKKNYNQNIPIDSKRIQNIVGDHSICYKSNEDILEIKHSAISRDGFALGALTAAEWIIGKKGVYSMQDVIKF